MPPKTKPKLIVGKYIQYVGVIRLHVLIRHSCLIGVWFREDQ